MLPSFQNIQNGFGRPTRDLSAQNLWAGKIVTPQMISSPDQFGNGGPTGPTGRDGNTGPTGRDGNTGPTGTSFLNSLTPSVFGEYLYWNGTEWTTGGPSVTIGYNAGVNASNVTKIVSIGYGAGSYPSPFADGNIAIGNVAGCTGQGSTGIIQYFNQSGGIDYLYYNGNSIAIGRNAGAVSQTALSVAIGDNAGFESQNVFSIAVGYRAGNSSQGIGGIAIGFDSGNTGQGFGSVAVGVFAGNLGQSLNSVAIGAASGSTTQGQSSVAVGHQSGNHQQGENSVAVGDNSGNFNQGNYAVALGTSAGKSNQGAGSISIGYQAGFQTQNANSIAIGYNAGQNSLAQNSIVIGYGSSTSGNTAVNSISIGNFNTVDAFSVALGNSVNTTGHTGCIILNSNPSGVSCLASNQFVISGVNTAAPNPNGPVPVLQKLTNQSATSANIWLPIQINNIGYLIPIFYQ